MIKWPRLDVLKRECDDYDEGMDCEYYEYGGMGYKLYKSAIKAHLAYLNQKKCAELGIAPPCYQFRKLSAKTSGYITEVAMPCWDYGIVDEQTTVYKEVEGILDRHNITYEDIHEGNVGYYNNELVILDFCEHMFEDITSLIEEKYGRV